MQDFVTSDGTTFSPTGIIGSIEPVLMDGVREMLAHAEKQAREEDIEEAFEKSAWGKAKAEMLLEEGRQRGADEMVERCVEEAKRIADLYRKAQYGLDDEIL